MNRGAALICDNSHGIFDLEGHHLRRTDFPGNGGIGIAFQDGKTTFRDTDRSAPGIRDKMQMNISCGIAKGRRISEGKEFCTRQGWKVRIFI